MLGKALTVELLAAGEFGYAPLLAVSPFACAPIPTSSMYLKHSIEQDQGPAWGLEKPLVYMASPWRGFFFLAKDQV